MRTRERTMNGIIFTMIAIPILGCGFLAGVAVSASWIKWSAPLAHSDCLSDVKG